MGSAGGRKRGKTYQDRSANEDQIPHEVFLAWETRIALLKLAHILVHEVRIEEYAKLGSSDKEACYWPPNLREKPEKKLRCVDKVVSWHESEMYTDGEEECGSCGGPGTRSVIASAAVSPPSKTNLAMAGNRQ
jgi:hypothetical protein